MSNFETSHPTGDHLRARLRDALDPQTASERDAVRRLLAMDAMTIAHILILVSRAVLAGRDGAA
jgi:hypothetical protein